MRRLAKAWDVIRESEGYQQLKSRYDELDSQSKLYLNLGALGGVVLAVFLSLVVSVAKLNGMKSDINEREELIGYLQRSADTIRQLKSQSQGAHGGADLSSPLPAFLENVIATAGLDRSKVDVGTEKSGAEDKETKESLVELKLSQVNLRQLVRFLFTLTEQGAARNLNVKDLNVDTKGDPTGWMDAAVTVAALRSK